MRHPSIVRGVLLFEGQSLRPQGGQVKPNPKEYSDESEDTSDCEDTRPNSMTIRSGTPPIAQVARLNADANNDEHFRESEKDPDTQTHLS